MGLGDISGCPVDGYLNEVSPVVIAFRKLMQPMDYTLSFEGTV